ncbi:phosphomevalonate kinase [Streptomyces iconiensis]|uniref:Phosphomevalonate kinase n=1 Tax=Streptomyces iconiensis TaxID=1384038 RepID=A0ABT7A1B9_9ACTN|nr:phosphomevalonate kinase [Streptomyces iconiensis]MDJ1135137.1 phosphomevalonate kinase [Streptomyces iconiensis]
MTPAVTHRAPGKLLVAGEYAVLEPGQPSIVLAVDRFITVEASTPGDAQVVLATDLLPHEVRMFRGRTGLGPLDRKDTRHLRGTLAHLVSAVEVVDQLRSQLGLAPVPLRLTVRSDLHEQGTKIGLGSSGAVTVAAVTAMTDFCGMPMPPELRLRLALLASIRVDTGPSGADLAASTWGGWILYRAPDRARLLRRLRRDGVAETLLATWPGLTVRALPPPNALSLHTGWSGSPASTSTRVGHLSRTTWWHSAARSRFLTRSTNCVSTAVHALERDDPQALLAAVRGCRRLLSDLDHEAELGIFTAALTDLCTAAEACGGAGKPSGAGGGDCGIALLPSNTDPRTLHRRWAAAGITALSLRVTEAPRSPDDVSAAAGPTAAHRLIPRTA